MEWCWYQLLQLAASLGYQHSVFQLLRSLPVSYCRLLTSDSTAELGTQQSLVAPPLSFKSGSCSARLWPVQLRQHYARLPSQAEPANGLQRPYQPGRGASRGPLSSNAGTATACIKGERGHFSGFPSDRCSCQFLGIVVYIGTLCRARAGQTMGLTIGPRT